MMRRTFIALLILTFYLWQASPVQANTISDDDTTSHPQSISIVINEIHYDPDIKTEAVEFIELYNRGDSAADLSNWVLYGAVEYVIPADVIIPPDGYLVIAQNPAAIAAKWGVAALGPFTGKLSNDGETIVLRNRYAHKMDEVSYGLGFPWPTVGDAPGHSIGLLDAHLDNNLPGYWRSQPPSPGWANGARTSNPVPHIDQVQHSPRTPTDQDNVLISARVMDAQGVTSVELYYQLVAPGYYIAIGDPEYTTQWTVVGMNDAGSDGDPVAGDQVYGAVIPASLNQHRWLIRYRILAYDQTGQSILVPYADDPQPNFAYFVHNGVAPWTGAVRPGKQPPLGVQFTYHFDPETDPAVYHLIAKDSDVEDSQWRKQYRGREFLWKGAFVYNGHVYDHIRYRPRGGAWRFGMGKNMWKFDFNRGHYFQAHDAYGRPYKTTWDKLNFSAIIQHKERMHRGEHGLFEAVGFRLFNLAGIEAPHTHYVHFRIIDDPEEVPDNQYHGDFWGLYLVLEQMDGRFLDEHGLPDGNLYKMEWDFGELNNQGPTAVSNRSDLRQFMDTYKTNPSEEWWRANVDVPRYHNYRSILEAIHHYDINQTKNYFFYLNPETNLWIALPWDLDQSWADNMTGTGNEPFRRFGLLGKTSIEFRNRLREILDLLFNTDQTYKLIDEYAAIIYDPNKPYSFTDVDRAMWDYNSVMSSEYVVSRKASAGEFYKISPTDDFPGMVQVMKNWVVHRTEWIHETILTDRKLPNTPLISYIGPSNFPADQLRFQTSLFSDPQGPQTFAAMKWRVAEFADAFTPGYVEGQPPTYEIDASWESPELTTFSDTVQLPLGSCRPGYICRVRVRMKDESGYWSYWSPPIEFRAGAPQASVTSDLKITEIMYHPRNHGNVPHTELEFIELTNSGAHPIDLSNMQFSEGIEFTFPIGTVLNGGEIVVLAKDSRHFANRYGFTPFGEYDAKLSNGGETITLHDAYSSVITSLTYNDKSPWPARTDGEGYSIVLNAIGDVRINLAEATNWRRSTGVDGSPGAVDPLPIVINEVLARPVPGQKVAIELYNPNPTRVDISHWYLSNTESSPHGFQLPAGTVIPAGGYLVLNVDDFGSGGSDVSGFDLDPNQVQSYLFSATADGRLTGYRYGLAVGVTQQGTSLGRHVVSTGEEHFVTQQSVTLGGPNDGPRVGPIIISEVMYHPQAGDEFIRFTNISSETVRLYDPAHPENTWRILNMAYWFPTGIEVPPGGDLLLVSGQPSASCQREGENSLQVIGPYTNLLSDHGQSIVLEMPSTPDANGVAPYIVMDSVTYGTTMPWPSEPNGTGASLLRMSEFAYADDPANWAPFTQRETVVAAASNGPVVELCHFDVELTSEDRASEASNAHTVTIQWVTRLEQNVQGFHILRSPSSERTEAEKVTQILVAASGTTNGVATYHWSGALNALDLKDVYWLEAVGPQETTADIAFTVPKRPVYSFYFPLISAQ